MSTRKEPLPPTAHKPTEVTIPLLLDQLIPEVELYRRLTALERRLDVFTQRKWLDLQEYASKPVVPDTRVLRVFVSNTSSGQPWQEGETKPQWTLKVEGRLVDEADGEHTKFSSLLSGILVDLVPNQHYPQLAPDKNNTIVEWHREGPQQRTAAPAQLFDGVHVTREGTRELQCVVTIQPKEYPAKWQLSNPLGQLLGVLEMTQHEVIYGVWQYIQLKGLFTPPAAKDEDTVAPVQRDARTVYCDDALFQLFGVAQFRFPQLMELLGPHMRPREAVRIDYTIDPTRANTLGECVVDIPIEAHAEPEARRASELEALKQQYHTHDQRIAALNSKILMGVALLNQLRLKQQFYNDLADSPVEFLQQWYDSHCTNLKILAGDDGYTEENMRRSDFYTATGAGPDGERLLRDNVLLLLASNRM